jgi:hypothetical protein
MRANNSGPPKSKKELGARIPGRNLSANWNRSQLESSRVTIPRPFTARFSLLFAISREAIGKYSELGIFVGCSFLVGRMGQLSSLPGGVTRVSGTIS